MKTLKYIVDKEDNKPFKVLSANLMRRELDALPRGKYELSVKKLHRKATHQQFSYLYGILYPMFLLAAWDNGYTTDDFADVSELDAWCKTRWANKPITNRETGEVVNVPLNKSAFVTIDEIVYCNTLRDFASEYWGVYIPEPDINLKKRQK